MNTIRPIRITLLLFIVCLMLSGITAIPVAAELKWLMEHVHFLSPSMRVWFSKVYDAVNTTNAQYPFLQYGSDWLAFAHIMIALAFIGPLRDPVKNKWVIDWGIICCFATFLVIVIAGPLRGIPWFHMVMDSVFGVIGLILLFYVKHAIQKIERNEKIFDKTVA